MKNDSAEYGSVHHPWGVIRPQSGRENIDGRLTRTGATARRWAWEVERMTELDDMTEQDLAVGPID